MSPTRRILVLFAHPAIRRSRVNRRLIEAIRDLDGVRVHDLYEAYPDFDVDVHREQALLIESDAVVLQHPFYWFSTPALVKQWEDLVLEHGWAFGRNGDALRGKLLFNAVTAGGGEAAYSRTGRNHFTIRELLAPIEQSARLCGMVYLPPFVVHGTHQLDEDAIAEHAAAYRRALMALRDNRLNLERLRAAPRLNSDLDGVIEA